MVWAAAAVVARFVGVGVAAIKVGCAVLLGVDVGAGPPACKRLVSGIVCRNIVAPVGKFGSALSAVKAR